jgi:glycosyltransferase involved in cell wall biosynthesis
MLKIAILGIKTYPAFAGADRVVEFLLREYNRENHYYVYLWKQKNNMKFHCKDNLHFVYLPSPFKKHFGTFVYFLLCTIHVMLKGKYDIIHIHNVDFGLFIPLLKLKKFKIIGTSHGSPYLRKKWGKIAKLYLKFSEQVFFRYCDVITTVQRKQLNIINENYLSKAFYIPNGVPEELINVKGNFDYAKYNINPGEYVLFACGRLDPTKGLHYLLEAYNSNRIENKLLIIGDFSHAPRKYLQEIESLINNNKNIVIIKELLPKEKLYEVLRNSKLFVFPSEVEAASMLLLEAIACKSPVVCSDIDENKDIVGRDYKYLFKSGNSEDLGKKIKMALNDVNIKETVESLYLKCISQFSWKAIARRYEELYLKLLKEEK